RGPEGHPGIVLAVPSDPATAPALLRTCFELARRDGRVCVFLEPIALYHQRDLHEPGDGGWLTLNRHDPSDSAPVGSVARYGQGTDIALVTFGNGLRMSLQAVDRLAALRISAAVVDLRWLAPLPEAELLAAVSHYPCVLVVDETRRSGG